MTPQTTASAMTLPPTNLSAAPLSSVPFPARPPCTKFPEEGEVEVEEEEKEEKEEEEEGVPEFPVPTGSLPVEFG